jgi:hypothetical protein
MGASIRGILVALALALALAGAALGVQDERHTAPATPPQRQTTLACLKRTGALVAPIVAVNPRLQALHDLAQKISVQIRIRQALVGMAFEKTISGATLLVELLQSQNDPYRVDRRTTIVILSPRAAPSARAAVLSCVK